MAYLLIFFSAIFVNNIVFSQFLGICPFLGVSKKVDTALGMSAAVAFVLTIATIVTYLIQILLIKYQLEYLQTIAFILVIAALVQMVEIILKKVSPALYQALGVFLPLITTNCAILGVAILVAQGTYNAQGMEPNLLESFKLPDVKVETAANTGGDTMTYLHMRNWMECVRSRMHPNAPAQAGYNHSIATIMCNAALRTGEKVTFDEKTQNVMAGGKVFKY